MNIFVLNVKFVLVIKITHVRMYTCTCTCVPVLIRSSHACFGLFRYTVEPLYCRHHWAKENVSSLEGVLISEVDLYTKVYHWIRKVSLFQRCPNFFKRGSTVLYDMYPIIAYKHKRFYLFFGSVHRPAVDEPGGCEWSARHLHSGHRVLCHLAGLPGLLHPPALLLTGGHHFPATVQHMGTPGTCTYVCVCTLYVCMYVCM